VKPPQASLALDTPAEPDGISAECQVPLKVVSAVGVADVSADGEVVPFMGDEQLTLNSAIEHATAMAAMD
jgi:hypothetical protein